MPALSSPPLLEKRLSGFFAKVKLKIKGKTYRRLVLSPPILM